jgi:precorrin-6B methylase 2
MLSIAAALWLVVQAPAPATKAQEPAQEPARPSLDVPYVPTPQPVVDEMLRLAKPTKDDVLYDLGCGDGRIVITAAKKYGTRGIGFDLDPQRIKESRANAEQAGVTDRVTFKQQDLFKTPIGEATVLTMYLLPSVNMKLRPRILSELRPGTRVVSHAFTMEDWRPDEQSSAGGGNVYFWLVPANLTGTWKVSGLGPAGASGTLEVEQTFQQGKATLDTGKGAQPVRDFKIEGARVTFTVDAGGTPTTLQGRVEGDTIEGLAGAGGTTATSASAQPGGWKATRQQGTKKPLDAAAASTASR